jgi:hypothetical protein
MARTGKVTKCNYVNFSYQSHGNTLYRHDIEIELPGGEKLSGAYDSPKMPQTSFPVGQTVDFETMEATYKGGKQVGESYLKFKLAKKDNSSFQKNYDTPQKRNQIRRSVAFFCAMECQRNGIGKDDDLIGLAERMGNFIIEETNKHIGEGTDEKQASISVQGALKLIATGSEQLNIENIDVFWKVAAKLIAYIFDGPQ